MAGIGRKTATAIAVCALGAGLAAGLSPAAALAAAPSSTQTHWNNDWNNDWDDFGSFDRGGYWDDSWHYGQFERRGFRAIGRYSDWQECRDAAWRGQLDGYWDDFSYEEVGGVWILYA